MRSWVFLSDIYDEVNKNRYLNERLNSHISSAKDRDSLSLSLLYRRRQVKIKHRLSRPVMQISFFCRLLYSLFFYKVPPKGQYIYIYIYIQLSAPLCLIYIRERKRRDAMHYSLCLSNFLLACGWTARALRI
jgi:hypothetical protein